MLLKNASFFQVQEVKIFSVDGKMVKAFDKSQLDAAGLLDLSALSSGIYYVMHVTEKGIST